MDHPDFHLGAGSGAGSASKMSEFGRSLYHSPKRKTPYKQGISLPMQG
jgi:hypothetical protein